MALHQVDLSRSDEPRHEFGPYVVDKVVVHGRRPTRFVRMKEEDSRSRSEFTVTSPDGGVSVCSVPLALPFPSEIRLGCTAEVDGVPLEISKRWFRPVTVRGARQGLAIHRLGITGFRIRDLEGGSIVAEQRRGMLSVNEDVSPFMAVLIVAAIEVPLTEAVSPIAWLRGI